MVKARFADWENEEFSDDELNVMERFEIERRAGTLSLSMENYK